MKKTLSILLIVLLALSSVIGASAATQYFLKDTGATPDNSPTITQTEDNSYEIPDVTGTWKHISNDGCTIQVVNQFDNHVDLTIQCCSENASKIATSRLSLNLEPCTEGSETYGTAYFNYSDSFGSGGKGSIIVKGDVISLALVKEFDPCASWNITPAAGDYSFHSKDVDPCEADRFDDLPENQQIFDHTLPCPEIEGFWMSTTNEGASIEIANQDGFNADVIIELHNENYTKIATAKVPVTFYTDYNGDKIGAMADFEYSDSFGSSGTGSIIFDGEVIRLELNEEVGAPFSIAPADGVFTMAE